MPLIPFLFSLFSFVNLSIAGYVLQDDYNSAAFFDMFDFFTYTDPTHGFVQYIDQGTAWNTGLIGNANDKVYIGVDHTNVQPNGRPSIRLTSKNAYNSGSLVILDLEHMPGNSCGSWPAFWMVGPSWPNGGEIDIIEGVNTQNHNAMTLHTADGCSIYDNGNFTGSLYSDDCYVDAADQTNNLGCQITTSQYNTYGDGFNNVGGGVYAMEWTDEAISIWFFQRGAIPANVLSANPSPDSTWGKPLSQFTGCCDIPEFFSDNQIVFDVTFCGDWAGSVWSSDSTCSALSGSCTDYVANNPGAFSNAYWSINSLKVFEQTAKSSGKVALPAFCNNPNNPTQTETFISSASTISTETVPAETTSTVSSAVDSTTTETSSTQTSSIESTSSAESSTAAVSSSTEQTSTTAESSSSSTIPSSLTSASSQSSTAQSSSNESTSSAAQTSSSKQASSAASSSSKAQASSTAAETSSVLPSMTEVLKTLVLAVAADATSTQWSTVTTTLRQVVSVAPIPELSQTEQPSATENSETTPAANVETIPTMPSFAETSVLTTIVQAVSADATTTQWVTITTSIERAITAPADTTITQWTTQQVSVAPDVYTTLWTTITSTAIYQKAKRTALPESLMLGGKESAAATSQTTSIETPSPSRRWLPRHWGRARN
ncbi:endo-1,3(4)-beta-glucanase [Aureobasidium sp. EXF-10728]|nr:endo-1,3(4)-beta-glucanase [Aureobasidium sp. EXF-10728]